MTTKPASRPSDASIAQALAEQQGEYDNTVAGHCSCITCHVYRRAIELDAEREQTPPAATAQPVELVRELLDALALADVGALTREELAMVRGNATAWLKENGHE